MSTKLTSTFQPPSRCFTDTYRMTNSDTKVGPYYALLGGGGYSSCMPSGFYPDPAFFYSPGLYCPAGYTTACSSTRVVGSDTTTIATCCPRLVTRSLLQHWRCSLSVDTDIRISAKPKQRFPMPKHLEMAMGSHTRMHFSMSILLRLLHHRLVDRKARHVRSRKRLQCVQRATQIPSR